MEHGTFNWPGRGVPVGIFVGIVAAGVALAPPAAAEVHLEQYVEVPQCTPATGQACPQIPRVNFTNDQAGFVTAQFTTNSNGCSDANFRFLQDNYPVSDWIRASPNQTISSTFFSKSGSRELGVMATGIEGGCNTGILNAWGGTVRLDSKPAEAKPAEATPTEAAPTEAAPQPACLPWIITPSPFCLG